VSTATQLKETEMASNDDDKVWIAHLPMKPGHLTVAVQMVGEDKAQAGFAWCSPRDQFCRWLGRRIAQGRMAHQRSGVLFDVFPPREGEKPHVSLFRQALGTLDKLDVPTWAADRAPDLVQ
jgi:hypothetical protein